MSVGTGKKIYEKRDEPWDEQNSTKLFPDMTSNKKASKYDYNHPLRNFSFKFW